MRRQVAGPLLVEHHVRGAGRPQPHRLGAVLPAEGQPELVEHHLDPVGVLGLDLDVVVAGRHVDVRDPVEHDGRARAVDHAVVGQEPGRPVLEPDEGPQGVLGGPAGVGLPEHVVEHLQRQRPRVPRAHEVGHEPAEVPGPLAGEQPVVPAPGQHVHGQGRGVGELGKEDLLPRDLLDRCRVVPAGEDVEAVQAHPDRLVVGQPGDLPRATVVVHEPSPRERLVGHPDPVGRREVTQPAQLLGRHLVGADRRGRDVAADQHGADAEPPHGLEARPGPAQVVLEQVRPHALEVPERLVQVQAQAQPVGERPDLLGAAVADDEVGLEDLDAVEAGVGAGVELVLQAAAEADGRYRLAHVGPPPVVQVPGRRVTSRWKWACIRVVSGSRPVIRRRLSAACPTAIPPPSSVARPRARARRRSSVSRGR